MRMKINTDLFYSGDYVIGSIPFTYTDDKTGEEVDDVQEVFGRVYIKDFLDESYTFYICQNRHDGEYCGEEHSFGYRCSWVAKVNSDGKITSCDLRDMRHATIEEIVSNFKKTEKVAPVVVMEDDDPMPDSWSTDEELPF